MGGRRGRVLTLVLLASLAVLAAAPATTHDRQPPVGGPQPAAAPLPARVVVHARDPQSRVHVALLGVNHHYNRDGYALWDAVADRPVPAVVAGSRRAGIQSVRFPGGTIANLYDWKRAIGNERECQVDGRGTARTGFRPVPGLAFGPDEYMAFIEAIGGQPLLMVPAITGTPAEAAAWVEYMNAPAGAPGNPGGGVDWADVRAANGHPASYQVRRWEIGNEPSHAESRHWMSADDDVAVRQYAFGGHRDVVAEPLGTDCRHPPGGVPSDGSAAQTFSVVYPPVSATRTSISVAGTRWHRVDDLADAGPDERAYELRAASGEVVFGDGEHGAVPPDGAVVRASYRSVHQGFFAFARAMHAVDQDIDVCSGWDTPAFATVAGARRYDCLTAHPLVSFEAAGTDDWADAVEGHDRQQLAVANRRDKVVQLLRALPDRSPLLLTEFSFINGDTEAFPMWSTSMSHAVAMTGLWAAWLRLGIGWGMGDDLLWGFDRAVLGPAPDYTFTADAVTRQALLPMFAAGGRVVRTLTPVNPVRDPGLGDGTYAGLTVIATRGAGGGLWLLVANRLPYRSVETRVRVGGATLAGTAQVRRVEADEFTDWNHPGRPPAVRLATSDRGVGRGGFTHTFAPSSVTVFRLPTS